MSPESAAEIQAWSSVLQAVLSAAALGVTVYFYRNLVAQENERDKREVQRDETRKREKVDAEALSRYNEIYYAAGRIWTGSFEPTKWLEGARSVVDRYPNGHFALLESYRDHRVANRDGNKISDFDLLKFFHENDKARNWPSAKEWAEHSKQKVPVGIYSHLED